MEYQRAESDSTGGGGFVRGQLRRGFRARSVRSPPRIRISRTTGTTVLLCKERNDLGIVVAIHAVRLHKLHIPHQESEIANGGSLREEDTNVPQWTLEQDEVNATPWEARDQLKGGSTRLQHGDGCGGQSVVYTSPKSEHTRSSYA